MASHLVSLWKWDFLELGNGLLGSGKLPTYPSPNLTFCPKWDVSNNVNLGEG